MGHSHSQAITQGADKELKLYCWFCFTEKNYDAAIKTGWGLKNIYIKSKISKFRAEYFSDIKQEETPKNRMKSL